MPAIDERARHELFVAVQDTLGPTHADTLMSLLPPVGWADVATKQDLSELDGRMAMRFERVDERFNIVDERFLGVGEGFKVIEERFKILDERFKAIDYRFDSIDHRFEGLEHRIEGLEHKVIGSVHEALNRQTRVVVVGLTTAIASIASLCVTAMALAT
jgi:predicted nuclease with TOPRIM domain